MCEFCEEGKSMCNSNTKDLGIELHSGTAKLVAYGLDEFGWDISVSCDINYCPMCRKEAGRVTIREYVFRNNISYKQLAKQLNISQAYLCDLSKGRRETISENLANRFKEVAPEIDITTEIRKYYKIK